MEQKISSMDKSWPDQIKNHLLDGSLREECEEKIAVFCPNCGFRIGIFSNGLNCPACLGEKCLQEICVTCGFECHDQGKRKCHSVKVYQQTGKLVFSKGSPSNIPEFVPKSKISQIELIKILKEIFDGTHNCFISPNIPKRKLDNITNKYQTYLKTGEKILLIYDGTMFGSAKDGFILTSNGVGWSETFGEPKYCLFNNLILENIRHQGDTELIFENGKHGAFVFSNQINEICVKIKLLLQKILEKIPDNLIPLNTKNIKNHVTLKKYIKVFEGTHNCFIGSEIPKRKQKNVSEKYQYLLKKGEEILLVYDGTLFGSAKDGFILTSNGIGWSKTLGAPNYTPYANLILDNIRSVGKNDLNFENGKDSAFVFSDQLDDIMNKLKLFIQKIQC